MSVITQQDVAEKAGVSRSTVRDVLTGRPRIPEATRARVLSAVRELNYRPNAAARDLVLQRGEGKGDKSQEVTIDLWTDFIHDDFRNSLYRNLHQAFEELHPNLKISVTSDTQVGPQESVDRLILALATGASPACQYVSQPHFNKLARLGLAADITAFVEEWDSKNEFMPRVWEAMQHEGRFFGIPTASASTHLLHTNRALLAAQGWKSAPANWDELVECAKELTDPKQQRYGLALPSLDGELPYLFVDLLYSHGGSLRGDRSSSWQLAMDEEPAVRALQLIHDLRWKHKVLPPQLAKPWQELKTDFLYGRVAMSLSSILVDRTGGMITSLDEVEMAPLPSGPDGKRFCQLGFGTWIINAHCTPAQQRAAWEYLKFECGHRSLQIVAETHAQHGLVSTLISTLENCPEQRDSLAALPLNWRQAISAALDCAQTVPYPSGYELETLRHLLLGILTDPTANIRQALRQCAQIEN